jgi:hypothetical protein
VRDLVSISRLDCGTGNRMIVGYNHSHAVPFARPFVALAVRLNSSTQFQLGRCLLSLRIGNGMDTGDSISPSERVQRQGKPRRMLVIRWAWCEQTDDCDEMAHVLLQGTIDLVDDPRSERPLTLGLAQQIHSMLVE